MKTTGVSCIPKFELLFFWDTLIIIIIVVIIINWQHIERDTGKKNNQYFHLYFLKDTLRWGTILSGWKVVIYWLSQLKINILLQHWMFCFKVLIWRLIERKVGFIFWSQIDRWREGREHLKGKVMFVNNWNISII